MGARGQRPDLSSCWLAPFLEPQCFCYLWPAYPSSQEALTLMLWIWTHQSPPPPMTVPMAGQTRADATVWTLQINLEFKGNKLIFTTTQQVGAEPRKSRIPKHSHSSSGVLPGLLVSLHSIPSLSRAGTQACFHVQNYRKHSGNVYSKNVWWIRTPQHVLGLLPWPSPVPPGCHTDNSLQRF